MAGTMEFTSRVDKLMRVFTFELENLDSLLHAESTVDATEGFHAGDWVSLPEYFSAPFLSDLATCGLFEEVFNHVFRPASAPTGVFWVVVPSDVAEVT